MPFKGTDQKHPTHHFTGTHDASPGVLLPLSDGTQDNTTFPSWPQFDDDEILAAVQVLRSGRVNRWTGEQNELFEEEFAEFVGCQHAVAVANGTLALELALYALGISQGDEVIVSCRTFIASASAVVMRGAKPIVADVDPVSQNITAETVRPLLTERTRAIIAVHLAGWPCDMDELRKLAKPRGIYLIEDCAQALGATYKGQPVGSFGDVAAFSFCQDKIMTTGGEGGMLTTNNVSTWQRAWSYKDHGKCIGAIDKNPPQHGFRWLHETFGTNWRMTEMQAAIGRVCLRKVPDWVAIRRRHAARLTEHFTGLSLLRTTPAPDTVSHAYYKYYCFLNPEYLSPGSTRATLLNDISNLGVPCFTGTCSEIYRERAFASAGLSPNNYLPVAKELGDTSIMLPVHPTLATEHIDMFADAVKRSVCTHSLTEESIKTNKKHL